jgi:hypothetical protein
MSTVGLFLLLSIFILTGEKLLTNLYTFERELAVESNCDPKILSLLGYSSGSDNERSFVIASDDTDSTSGISQVMAGNNGDDMNTNIESQIPPTISAIPFP